MQFYKGDALEQKFYETGKVINQNLSLSKDQFFDEAYSCFVLGEVLYDSERAPLANAIDRVIFREAFATIFESFIQAGTFESYLTVFRNIFGGDVDVQFTVPAPGKLLIDITATGVQYSNLIARSIVDGAYVYDNIVDENGDKILALTPKGFDTEYEAEQMLFEMVPGGIYTEVTLTI